jgi:ATP phosphoribosyltransferase regulatory subunit HisZ
VSVTIHVADVRSAGGEIQGLLRRLGARRVEHESLQNAEILTTELQAGKLKELFETLKTIGDVKEKGGSPEIPQGESARIRIEVISQP